MKPKDEGEPRQLTEQEEAFWKALLQDLAAKHEDGLWALAALHDRLGIPYKDPKEER